MYVKRGYIPDGSGVWYRDKVCEQNAECGKATHLQIHKSS